MMSRLHPDKLGELKAAVTVPAYDRATVVAGIVHLGLGAFHRAHQAVYTDDAIALAGGAWAITGVSLRSPTVSQQLTPQDCLYSVLSEDGEGWRLRVIGAIHDVLVAPQNPLAVVRAIARSTTRIVTLTITEKGYHLAPDGMSLDRSDARVRADLEDPQHPATAVGLLALGLRERHAGGGDPLTILSCDNLAENSRLLRAVLVDYLKHSFPAVLAWLDRSVTFPCSMVDRIVPAMTSKRQRRQAALLGLADEAAVSTEPFSQWIIEDTFAAGCPAWDRVGAQFVADILPYENIKLRLLNASHSAIAYCGLLADKDTVDEVMAENTLRQFIERLMQDDLAPALTIPASFDINAYRAQLLARFSNACLEHRCQQIAMDGSEKIAQRWLPTLQAAPAPLLRRALAVWCYFILCTEGEIDDPRGDRLLDLRASQETIARRIELTLACARITSDSVNNFDELLNDVELSVELLEREGIRALLAASMG